MGIAYVFFFSFFDACQCLTFIIRSLFFMNSILRRIFENSTYLLFSQPFIKTEKKSNVAKLPFTIKLINEEADQ